VEVDGDRSLQGGYVVVRSLSGRGGVSVVGVVVSVVGVVVSVVGVVVSVVLVVFSGLVQ